MTNSELSKRNQEFIFHLTKLLKNSKSFDDEKTDSTLSTVKQRLLEGQKKGRTARQIFGTPTEYFQDLIDPKGAALRRKRLASKIHTPAKNNKQTQSARQPRFTQNLFQFSFWTEFVDTAWTLLTMFAVLYAITGLIPTKTRQDIGLLTLVFFSLITGAAYVLILRVLTPDPAKDQKRPLIQRIGLTVSGILAWFVVFSAVSFAVPRWLNPSLNANWLILIAIAAGGSYYFWRKNSSLPRGFLVIGGLATNASLQYRQKHPKIKRGGRK